MPYDVNATFSFQQAKVENVEPVDLYVLNASNTGFDPQYYINYNIDVYGYQMSSDGTLLAAEQLYTGLPIARSDVNTNNTGEISNVTISIPNTDRVIESLIQNNDYFRGNEVYLISAFTNQLQVGSTANHIGVTEDRNAAMVEKLYVDGVSSNEQAVSFSCKPKFVIKNVVLPGRTYSAECSWKNYAGTECDPTSALDTGTYPSCDFSLRECKERDNEARFGGFPGIPRRGIVIVN